MRLLVPLSPVRKGSEVEVGPHFLLLCAFWYSRLWGGATHILGMVPHLSQVSGSSLTDALRAFP